MTVRVRTSPVSVETVNAFPSIETYEGRMEHQYAISEDRKEEWFHVVPAPVSKPLEVMILGCPGFETPPYVLRAFSHQRLT